MPGVVSRAAAFSPIKLRAESYFDDDDIFLFLLGGFHNRARLALSVAIENVRREPLR